MASDSAGSSPRATARVTAGLLLLLAAVAGAEPPLPPVPNRHVEDRAGLLDAGTASRLAEKLAAFEAQSGHQVVVAIYPSLQGAVLEDFTVRTAQKWRVGRKSLSDGVVVFVFTGDRAIRLEVGYGLEEKIPDAIASRIVNDVMIPQMRAGQPAAAVEGGVDAVMAATRGDWSGAAARKPDAPAVPYGDVPQPPEPGFHDDAGLLTAPQAERVRQAVATFTRETGCPLTVQTIASGTVPGDDPAIYAFRSHMRRHFVPVDGPDPDAAVVRAMEQPGLGLFVFVARKNPWEGTSGAYGGGRSCLNDHVLRGLQREVLWPRLPLAPMEALVATVETAGKAAQGSWEPGPVPDPFQALEERERERLAQLPLWLQAANAAGSSPWTPLAVVAVLLLLLALAVRVFGWKRVVRALASSGGGGRSYSSSGSSSFSSSSRSSFSGGGGSFGGGGASGRW